MPRTGRTLTLSRDEVAHGALAIADAEGLAALSMRRLAADLGVGTMTLYGYVRSKDELIEAAVDAAAEDLDVRGANGSARGRVRTYAVAVRRWIGRHPWLVELSATQALGRPALAPLSEGCTRVLREAGLPPLEARRCLRLMLSYAFGSAAFGTNDDEDFLYGLERLFDGIDARLGQLGAAPPA